MIARSHQLMHGARYEADYEVQVKNGNEKVYIAYIIEQGDLIVKKKCVCTSWNKCDMKNAIKLSKWEQFVFLAIKIVWCVDR